jgi:hypothetical protein
MIDNTMRNTFAVLTNRCSIEDILTQYTGEDAMFYGNPKNYADLDMFLDKLAKENGVTLQ